MSMIDATFLTAATVAAQQPRAVSDAAAKQFREALAASDCAAEACRAQSATRLGLPAQLNLDMEQAVMSHLPAANATPAEFAVGLLRAQVKVTNMAVAIELLSKTTQTLSQGVQTLTTRS
jgi:hypothetical protein